MENTMTKALLSCPFCGGEAFVATIEHPKENRPNGYRVHGQIICLKCQAACGTTGFDETYEAATEKASKAWNRRAQQDNKPLTLDELREMESRGDGIYVANMSGIPIFRGQHAVAAVLDSTNVWGGGHDLIAIYGRNLTLSESQYGKTWIAYRSKPQKEE